MKKNRLREGVFVAEGHKLVGDLLADFDCVYVAATADWISAHRLQLSLETELDEVTDDELRRISFVDTPQQVLAVFRQSVDDTDMMSACVDNLVLALDDVQNPGNLGTIIRLADWFGIRHIYCSKGCADVYNPKTVQATMGALARVNVHYVDLVSQLESLPEECPIYGTFLDGDNIYSRPLTQHGVIVMGNEGKGVSQQVADTVTERLFVPNFPPGSPTSESLNVAIATAIVCAEFRRNA